jgi:hypothetical protein
MPKQKNSWQGEHVPVGWAQAGQSPALPALLPFWLQQPADSQSQTIGQNLLIHQPFWSPHSLPSEQKQIRGHAGFCSPAFFCRDAWEWETRAVARPRPPADQPSATSRRPSQLPRTQSSTITFADFWCRMRRSCGRAASPTAFKCRCIFPLRRVHQNKCAQA